MPILENFAVPAGDEAEIEIPIGRDVLVGSSVLFELFAQLHGVPTPPGALFSKSLDHGVLLLSPPDKIIVVFEREDTLALLGSYYYELRVTEDDTTVTVAQGLLTVTGTEIRP